MQALMYAIPFYHMTAAEAAADIYTAVCSTTVAAERLVTAAAVGKLVFAAVTVLAPLPTADYVLLTYAVQLTMLDLYL